MIYCDQSNQQNYPFELPELPFEKDAFVPYFTSETFEYHYEKHHNAYVTNLNKLLENDKKLIKMDLQQIITTSCNSNTAIFNNAAQIWNHTFFWHSISQKGGGRPSGAMLEYIEKDFGSYEEFVSQFKQIALTQFGSGWIWLAYHTEKLKIIKTANADIPITEGMYPLIACDVWEHAYYIDYRNKKFDYISVFIEHMINWDFAEMHLHRAKQ